VRLKRGGERIRKGGKDCLMGGAFPAANAEREGNSAVLEGGLKFEERVLQGLRSGERWPSLLAGTAERRKNPVATTTNLVREKKSVSNSLKAVFLEGRGTTERSASHGVSRLGEGVVDPKFRRARGLKNGYPSRHGT